MKFIRIDEAKPKHYLMRDIYGYSGEVLLRRGLKLDPSYITKLQNLGVNGIYVSDNPVPEIEVKYIISDSLKNLAVSDIRNTFNLFENSKVTRVQAERAYQVISETVHEILNEIRNNQKISVSLNEVKLFDDYTYYHCVNVALISLAIGFKFGLSREKLLDLGFSSMIHDIGKVHIPRIILRRRDRLNAYEYGEIRKHVSWGFDYARDKLFLKHEIARGVLEHHERWDGSGYPNKLRENEISLFGRIIAIADVYDALISNRPYRKGYRPAVAIDFISSRKEKDFDPLLLDIFIDIIQPYPVGTSVLLSNNLEAIVVRLKQGYGTRPTIKVIAENGSKVKPYILDLSMPSYDSIKITS